MMELQRRKEFPFTLQCPDKYRNIIVPQVRKGLEAYILKTIDEAVEILWSTIEPEKFEQAVKDHMDMFLKALVESIEQS